MREIYVNGQYLSEENAKVSVFDRGFLFADGIYEVTSVLDGRLIDFDGHFERLERSMAAIEMKLDIKKEALLEMHRQLLVRNSLNEGLIYLQVTRGAAERDFAFPPVNTKKTIVAFTQEKSLIKSKDAKRGLKIITLEDMRWGMCDVKTVQLLYPSLAKMQAKSQGADDAWLMRDGLITEGTSNNAYIVTNEGVIVTRDLSPQILSGITRKAVLQCAKDLQIKIEERAFTPEEAANAKEAFVTSATTFVMPVIEIDGKAIGKGEPGPIAKKLREIYIEESLKSAI
ncbi:MAG: D-amino-acid transaminase [Devosiaceae bacterium]|nr:D-amino-acid transaminase [Devosiaceae bacterium]